MSRPLLLLTSCRLHTGMLVPDSSQHHQLVGGVVAGVALVGEYGRGEVEVSALVGGCLGLRAGKPLVGESSLHICDQGLFVLPDAMYWWSPELGGW